MARRADRGSYYLGAIYADRIAEVGATLSAGTVGVSFDNAIPGAVNELWKTELIRRS